MTKFRKRPVVIEATQWFKNGDHPLDYAGEEAEVLDDGSIVHYSSEYRKHNDWEGGVVRRYSLTDQYCQPHIFGVGVCRHCNNHMYYHGWIDTLEGGHIVCPGDWIITGVQGERYPCKPGIFAMTYDEVKDGE